MKAAERRKAKNNSKTAEWQTVKLGDVVDIKHGFAFQGEYFREAPPGDILVTPGNFLIGGGFNASKLKYYDGPVPEEFALREGDLIVTMTDLSKESDTLGYAAIVPASLGPRYLHNQRIGRVIITNEERLDKRYLYYLFRSKTYRDEILAGATGTTVKHTSPGRILAFEFELPPLGEQRSIASILGSLDDKIELNRQMNETLEQMAQALFKSWFVDFDPVRAKAEGRDTGLPKEIADLFPDSFENSELGEIPKGWKVGKLSDIAANMRRGIQPERIDSLTPYIGLEHMTRHSITLADWSHASELESNKFEFKRGEILFGKLRPYFHKVGVAPLDGVCSTDILVIAPIEKEWFGFSLGHLSSDVFVNFTSAGSTGTKMPRTSWNEMARYPIVLPPTSIAAWFSGSIESSVEKIAANIHESKAVSEIRNLLLPKLLSGEVRIS